MLQAVRLLGLIPEVCNFYCDRFHWLLVDEYQDTNQVQYSLICLLAGEKKNVCFSADDDLPIYSCRSVENLKILKFTDDFTGCTVVRLEQNYRSSSTILMSASEVIKQNCTHKKKALWTENPAGEKIRYIRVETDLDEARFVINEILRLRVVGLSLNKIAVFYPTNAQLYHLEVAMISDALPYHIAGGVRFYARQEVKDILAYLRILDNPADEVSLKRIINVPVRGIGHATVDKLSDFANRQRITLYDALAEASQGGLFSAGLRGELAAFSAMMERFKSLCNTTPLPELARTVMEESGYRTRLKESRDDDDAERLENLNQLLAAIEEFCEKSPEAGLSDFLKQVSLVSDQEQGESGKPSVTLLTLHAAKGLEFRAVFMIGMDEGLLPNVCALDNLDSIEEERRLCYVGMTCTREYLYLLNARRRLNFNEKLYDYQYDQEQNNLPSRFLKDIL